MNGSVAFIGAGAPWGGAGLEAAVGIPAAAKLAEIDAGGAGWATLKLDLLGAALSAG